MREGAVLHTGQENNRKLQALGRMQGHQRDHTAAVVAFPVGDLVGIRDQGDLLQELHQAALGIVFVELPPHGHQLGEVLHPCFVLRVRTGPQPGQIS